MGIFTKKSAAVLRRRIDFLRFSLFWLCGLVRFRNEMRFNYISIDIYTDPYKGSPNI